MPLLNSRGDVLSGTGGTPGYLNKQPIPFQTFGGGVWLTDGIVLVSIPKPAPALATLALWRPGEPAPYQELGIGANDFAAGQNVWVAWLSGFGFFWSLPEPTDPPSLASLRARGTCGPHAISPIDGTLAYIPSRAIGYGLNLHPLAGPDTIGPADAVAYSEQTLRAGEAIYQHGAIGTPKPTPAAPDVQGILVCDRPDGRWLVYWSDTCGFVVQLDGAKTGYLLGTSPTFFNPDVRSTIDGQLTLTWAGSQGEGTNITVRAIDTAQPRVLIVPPPAPTPIVVPPIAKACVLAWFSDVPTPAPENCTLGVNFHEGGTNDNLIRNAAGTPLAQYVANEQDPARLEAAIAGARQLHPTLPVVVYWPRSLWGTHVSTDYYGVEAYWHVGESRETFQAAVAAEIARHQKVWIVAQGYKQNVGNTQDTAHVVPVIAELARDHANVNGILPFSAGSRAGGWNDLDAATQQAWQDLFHSIAGVPDVPPVGPPPPIPTPPSGFIRPSTFGGTMLSEKGGLIGPGGKFGRMGPQGTSPFGGGDYATWRGMIFDGASPDGDYEFTLTEVSSGRGQCVDTATGCYAGMDLTKYGGDLHKVAYGKPADPAGYETFLLYLLGSGIKGLWVQFGPDAQQIGFGAQLLTWVKK